MLQPSGTGNWAFRYRHNGKPGQLTLGTVASRRSTPSPKHCEHTSNVANAAELTKRTGGRRTRMIGAVYWLME